MRVDEIKLGAPQECLQCGKRVWLDVIDETAAEYRGARRESAEEREARIGRHFANIERQKAGSEVAGLFTLFAWMFMLLGIVTGGFLGSGGRDSIGFILGAIIGGLVGIPGFWLFRALGRLIAASSKRK